MSQELCVVRCLVPDGLRFYSGYYADGFRGNWIVLYKTITPRSKFSADVAKMAQRQLHYMGHDATVLTEDDGKKEYKASRRKKK